MDDLLVMEYPWVREIARSDLMLELLSYLRTGRTFDRIKRRFPEIPNSWLEGALEALESLGVIKRLEIGNTVVYVLSDRGRITLETIKSFK